MSRTIRTVLAAAAATIGATLAFASSAWGWAITCHTGAPMSVVFHYQGASPDMGTSVEEVEVNGGDVFNGTFAFSPQATEHVVSVPSAKPGDTIRAHSGTTDEVLADVSFPACVVQAPPAAQPPVVKPPARHAHHRKHHARKRHHRTHHRHVTTAHHPPQTAG